MYPRCQSCCGGVHDRFTATAGWTACGVGESASCAFIAEALADGYHHRLIATAGGAAERQKKEGGGVSCTFVAEAIATAGMATVKCCRGEVLRSVIATAGMAARRVADVVRENFLEIIFEAAMFLFFVGVEYQWRNQQSAAAWTWV